MLAYIIVGLIETIVPLFVKWFQSTHPTPVASRDEAHAWVKAMVADFVASYKSKFPFWVLPIEAAIEPIIDQLIEQELTKILPPAV